MVAEERERDRRILGDSTEGLRRLAEVVDLGDGERDVLASGPVGRLAEIHEAIAGAIRQRTKHDAAHDTEDCRVRADAESESDDHGEGETPRPGQAAQREAKIRHEHWTAPVEVE